MRIAIDASRTTVQQRTGTENYALQLIRHLLALESEHEFHLYFRDEPSPELFPEHQYTAHIIPFLRAWTHVRFARELWRVRPDVTFVPSHTLPAAFPGKAVVTVHDLGYRYFPDAHPRREYHYLDLTTQYSATRADIVLADSIATQQDLDYFYNVTPEKVRVVYPGIDENLSRVRTSARGKYQLPERYLLFIGTLQPRKNIERLVQAFVQWQENAQRNDIVLALAGKAGWLYNPAWTEGKKNVRLLGYVADEDVAALYSGALGLVFPSLYEGFGFPVLEAMRCEIPVLCSSTSSLPELAGDAAILVNPESVTSIEMGIRQLVEDRLTRQSLVEKGKAQVKKFTWQKAAESALAALEEAAQ